MRPLFWPGGSPEPKASRTLRLSESLQGAWTQNTAGLLTTVGVDQSDGSILTSLVGGGTAISTTSPDPDDARMWWATWLLLDADGEKVTGDLAWSTILEIDFAGAPVTADDAIYGIGIINEASPVSATVDGVFGWVEFTTGVGNPRVRNNYLSAGTPTGIINSTANANTRGSLPLVVRARGASTNLIFSPTTFAADSAGERVAAGAAQTASPAAGLFGTGDVWILACGGRTATTAGTIQRYPRWRYQPPIPLAAL